MKMEKIVKIIREQIIKEFRALPEKSWVVDRHLLVVENFANQLCDLYKKANRQVVLLGVWLHDLGRARRRNTNHDLYGAQEAKRILKNYPLPKEKIRLIYEICRSHRCQEIKPRSLEAKILATADAMSHLTNGFYLRLFFQRLFGSNFEETKKAVLKKLERDFHNKIYFKEAKRMVRPLYDAWKKILSD